MCHHSSATNFINAVPTEDFLRESPELLKSLTTFLLNVRPVVFLTNFNTQVGQLTFFLFITDETHGYVSKY